jgi:hypothetical protein
MAEHIKQSNWADDEEYDSEEAEEGFGLEASLAEASKPKEEKK